MKQYNNLRDSVVTLIFLVIATGFFSWCGAEAASTSAAARNAIFFMMVLVDAPLVYYLITGCFEYCIIEADRVVSQKPFRKKIVIFKKDVTEIERGVVGAFILGLYKSEAYAIRSAQSEVILLVNEKNDHTVTEILNQYGYLNRKNDAGVQ